MNKLVNLNVLVLTRNHISKIENISQLISLQSIFLCKDYVELDLRANEISNIQVLESNSQLK